MDEIIHFISTHYELIINFLLAIISIVFFILRKNKNVLLDSSASYKLVSLVLEAEKKFGSGHGDEKLNYVISKYCESIGVPVSAEIFNMVKILIEKILSTPQKKK